MAVKFDAEVWIDRTEIYCFGGKPKTPPPPEPPRKSDAEIQDEANRMRMRLRKAGPGTNILTSAMGVGGAATTAKPTTGS